VLHECPYLPAFTGAASAPVRRAVVAGAQAAVFAAGGYTSDASQVRWREKLFDYDNSLGVAAGMIFGAKKSRFTIGGNATDFATIVISTGAAAT